MHSVYSTSWHASTRYVLLPKAIVSSLLDQKQYSLEYNTASSTGRCGPKDLNPGSPARRALSHCRKTVGHELCVFIINDLKGTKKIVGKQVIFSDNNLTYNLIYSTQRITKNISKINVTFGLAYH